MVIPKTLALSGRGTTIRKIESIFEIWKEMGLCLNNNKFQKIRAVAIIKATTLICLLSHIREKHILKQTVWQVHT